MYVTQHVFEASEQDARICAARVNRRQRCGWPATNRAVHAPGALPLPEPLHAVPVPIEAAASAALTGQADT